MVSSFLHVYRWLSLRSVLGLVVVFGVVVPIAVLLFLPPTQSKTSQTDGFSIIQLKPQLRTLEGEDGAALKQRISELERMRDAVRKELVDLERRRQAIQQETQTAASKLEDAKSHRSTIMREVSRAKTELRTARLNLQQINRAQRNYDREEDEGKEEKEKRIEAVVQLIPALPPKNIILPLSDGDNDGDNSSFPASGTFKSCRLSHCFDFSRCSLTAPFTLYIYNRTVGGGDDAQSRLFEGVLAHVMSSPYHTSDPTHACVYLVLVETWRDVEEDLAALPFWRGDGRNHVLLSLVNSTAEREHSSDSAINVGKAVVVKPFFPSLFRRDFDIVVPPIVSALPLSSSLHFVTVPRLLPTFRRCLLYFRGEWNPLPDGKQPRTSTADLMAIQPKDTEEIVLATQCGVAAPKCDSLPGEWRLCGSSSQRVAALSSATFSLILSGKTSTLHPHPSTAVHVRLLESLRAGAVPVIFADDVPLPFQDVIDWSRAAVIIPEARIPELNFLLRAVSERDILSMRRQGHFLWETYFSTVSSIVDSTVVAVRRRIGMPANAVAETPTIGVFPEGQSRPLLVKKMDEVEGFPPEGAGATVTMPPPRFQRNFTSNSYATWNNPPGALFGLPPVTPFTPTLPSGYQFMGPGRADHLHVTVKEGGPLNGPEFDVLLAGNVPDEQFSIVMLTYDRNQVLVTALQRLQNLQYLRTIFVVWNNPKPPPEDMEWPDIGIPIHIVATGKNSLNNRFLPFDKIETEAVLSMDDDTHLRHDEILLSFRVWRENRDRIVGFPGRFHAWDSRHPGKWNYNANYSCEMSMILTGAAFFHKYYMYLYSFTMPQAIRSKVDEYMNCEDIAMNFLVSHVTRKPPIKVTSRWTFRCPGCPEALSSDNSHFEERHDCINYFVKIYGYMPLLNTQFRADSILFKTRIPSERAKCFKFI